jgi:hypothetical protein
MKVRTVATLFPRTAFALGLALAGTQAFNTQAELVYGVSDDLDQLITFNSSSPQTILTARSISGLRSGEQIRGIDFIGNTLYGLGSGNYLYTINPNTAAATQVGASQFTPQLNGLNFGFNSSGSLFYVTSDLGQNMALTSGAVGAAGPNYPAASSIDAMAIDHVTGNFYGISGVSHNWLSLDPVHGTVSVIASTGGTFSQRCALDFAQFTDIPYFSATVAGQTQFYTVNKTTGSLTLIGTVGAPGLFKSGLDAMVVVPEPHSMALFAVGGVLVGLAIRRRR